MSGQELKNRDPSPLLWAWIATFLTFGVLVVLKAFCTQCLPEAPGSDWHKVLSCIEDGVSQLGTVALALIAVSGSPVLAAWVALVGLVLWGLGIVLVVSDSSSNLAIIAMSVGSGLILLAHFKDAAHSTSRWYARLLKPHPIRRLLYLLIASLIGISVLFSVRPQGMPEAAHRTGEIASVLGAQAN